MYLGIVVFGSLLSEVQNACEDMYHLLRNRSRLMLEVRQFLRDVSVPQVRPFVHACVRACVRACIHVLTRPHRTQHLLQKVMVWLDFDYSSRQRKMQEQSILEHVSAHSLTHAHTRVLFLALSLSLPHPLVLSPFPLSFTRLRWCCVTSHLLSHFTNAPSVAAAAVYTHIQKTQTGSAHSAAFPHLAPAFRYARAHTLFFLNFQVEVFTPTRKDMPMGA